MNFHWCLESDFEGRMLRLFDLGNRIEDQVVDYLKDSGVIDVSAVDKDGNQYRASILGGHSSGACDGFVKRVYEDNPEKVLLLEIKSANDKRFNELVKLQDYQGWSKTYQWQIQCYMGIFNLDQALVVVVNKNNSKIYSEIVDFIPNIWEEAQRKAEHIICSDAPPQGMGEKDWRLKTQSEEYRNVYLGKRLPSSVNCRNCVSSKPIIESNNAVWFCKRFNQSIDRDKQAAGCPSHLWRPSLVNATHIADKSTPDMMAYQAGIVDFYNVTAEHRGEYKYSSSEMRELSKSGFDTKMMMEMEPIKNMFDGEYVPVQVMDEENVPF